MRGTATAFSHAAQALGSMQGRPPSVVIPRCVESDVEALAGDRDAADGIPETSCNMVSIR